MNAGKSIFELYKPPYQRSITLIILLVLMSMTLLIQPAFAQTPLPPTDPNRSGGLPASGSCGIDGLGHYVKFTTGGGNGTGLTATATGGNGGLLTATYNQDSGPAKGTAGTFQITDLTLNGQTLLMAEVIGGAGSINPLWTFTPSILPPTPLLATQTDKNFSQFAICAYDAIGPFSLTKTVNSGSGSFTFTVVCKSPTTNATLLTKTVTLNVTEGTPTTSQVFGNVPVGAICTATETSAVPDNYNNNGPKSATVATTSGASVTINNTLKQGTITFVKVVDGGSAQPSAWKFNITGGPQNIAHNGTATLNIGSYVVTEDGGSANNAAYNLTAASGACSLTSGQINLTVTTAGGTCTVTNKVKFVPAPALSFQKSGVLDNGGDGVANAGDTIYYSLVVQNTGNVNLTGITVTDPLATVTCPKNTLATDADGTAPFLGESMTCQAQYTLTQADIDGNGGGDGDIDNTATADAAETDSQNASASVSFTRAPALTIVKTVKSVTNPDTTLDPTKKADQADDVIRYEIVVTNSGNQTLHNVVVDDNLTGTTGKPCAATLAPGVSCTVEVVYTVSQTDIDTNGSGDSDIDNTATADSAETNPQNASASVPVAQAPALTIEKTVKSVTNPGNSSSDPDKKADQAGDKIEYEILVTNSGNQTLHNVVVNDDLTGTAGVSCATTLLPKATCTITVYYTVTQADIDGNGGSDGDIDNTATADADETTFQTDSASVPVAQAPALTIEKTVESVTNPDLTSDLELKADQAGDKIHYVILVTNSGNQTLHNVTVHDSLANAVLPCADVLLPTESCTVEVDYWVTQADLDTNGGGDGDIDNTATADSDETGTVSHDAMVPVKENPALTIEKTVESVTNPEDQTLDPEKKADQAGDKIHYLIRVTNSGNQTLNHVIVDDDLTGTNDALCAEILPPGESCTVEVDYWVTQNDIDTNGGNDDGEINNTASADATETDPLSHDAMTPLVQLPALKVVKSVKQIINPDGSSDQALKADQADDEITYEIVVTNIGNQTLHNVLVDDDLTGTQDKVCADTLPPSESCTVEVVYTVSQNDIDTNGAGDGTIDNKATADSTESEPQGDSATVPVAQAPSLQIKKTVQSVVNPDATTDANNKADQADDVIHYEIVVTNNGNQTLSNVLVDDSLTGTVDQSCALTLAPKASCTVLVDYKVTQADIDNNGGGDGYLNNTATATATEAPEKSTSAEVPVIRTPALTIKKTVKSVTNPVDGTADPNQQADQAGDKIVYQIVVTNSGNQTLSNVTVDDNLTGAIDLPCAATLAPAQSCTVEVEYTVTQNDIDTNGGADGAIDNTATGDSAETEPKDASASVLVIQTPALTIKKSVKSVTNPNNTLDPNKKADQADDVIRYELVVTNIGNQTLNSVLVDDSLTDDNDLSCADTLAPTETCTVEVKYTVTQNDIDTNGPNGYLNNTATAVAAEAGPQDDSASVPVAQAPALTIDKVVKSVTNPGGSDDPDQKADQAGDKIHYEIVVTNTGNQTLINVLVDDDLTGTTGKLCAATLAPTKSCTITVEYTVKQIDLDSNGGNDDGDIDNTATADSDQTGPQSDSANIPVKENPAFTIEKSVKSVTNPDTTLDPNKKADQAGDLIRYAIVVTNNGNQTLHNVVVDDDLTLTTGAICLASLAPDASCTVEVAYKVTQADIDNFGGGDGDIDNIATADSDETLPQSDNVSVPVIQAPALTVEKVVKSITNPNGSPASPLQADQAGDKIIYQIIVTNSGNLTLKNVTVDDDLTHTQGELCTLELETDQSCTVEVEYTVQQSDIDDNGSGDGALDNTATADSAETQPETAKASVPIVRTPALLVEKAVKSVTNPDLTLDSNKKADQAGDKIVYQIVVTNIGNQTLTHVTIDDDLTGTVGVECPDALAPNKSCTLEVTYTVSQDDIDTNGDGDGKLTNTATADSQESDPDSASVDIPVVRTPEITIKKSVKSVTNPGGSDDPSQQADQAGDKIVYLLVVTNSGNQTLHNVVVDDDLTGTVEAKCAATLAPAESCELEATYTVTQEDIDTNGGGDKKINNTATADSQESEPDSASVDIPVAQAPALTIEKTVKSVTNPTNGGDDPDKKADQAGDKIVYQLVVTNIGNQTLHNVLIDDNLTGANDLLCADTLAVGKSCSVEVTYTVTQLDIDTNGGNDGYIDNKATSDANETDPVSHEAMVPIKENPALSIKKTVKSVTNPDGTNDLNLQADQEGDKIHYEIVVTNTGNKTLNNVTVDDNLTATTDKLCIATLAPDATCTVEVEYTVTQTDIDNNGGKDGDIDNTATADSDETDTVSHEAMTPVVQIAVLKVEKVVLSVTNPDGSDDPDKKADQAGDEIHYQIVATNSGNQTLHNVLVDDPLTGANDLVCSDSLAPGASCKVTVTYTVTQADLDNNGGGDGDIDNTATADSAETDPQTASSDVPVKRNPSLQIQKTTNGVDANELPGPSIKVGDPVKWEYIVTNTGNVVLNQVTVVDDKGVTVTCPKSTLNPGEAMTCSATGVAQAGQYVNTGTATGQPLVGKLVSDDDKSHYYGILVELAMRKDVRLLPNGGWTDNLTSVVVGANIEWRIVLENKGNVPLTTINLSDQLNGQSLDLKPLCEPDPPATLAVGATYQCISADTVKYNANNASLNVASVQACADGNLCVTKSDSAGYTGYYWAFTPGFWKNHAPPKPTEGKNAWQYTSYKDPKRLLWGSSGVFKKPVCTPTLKIADTSTLLDALSFSGGPDATGAAKNLLRAGVAALLNASFHETYVADNHPAPMIGNNGELLGPNGVIYYPYGSSKVIQLVNDALATCDRAKMLELATQLDTYNNGLHLAPWTNTLTSAAALRVQNADTPDEPEGAQRQYLPMIRR